jgi:alpha-tubulin suppressor-like RCC1 family protein
LKSDGSVANCGAHFVGAEGPIVIPFPLAGIKAVAGGWAHSMALKPDGTVAVWGDNSQGQTNVPSGLTNVIAISAADNHCLALKEDGTVVAWGGSADHADIPPSITNVVAISAGSSDLALKADGTVVAWALSDTNSKTTLAGLTNIVAISSGWNFLSGNKPEWLALRADGTLFGGTTYSVPADLTNIVAMCASSGTDHHVNLAVRTDGTVVGWGFAFYPPLVVPGLTNVTAVSSDSSHSIALIGDGPPQLSAHIENSAFADGSFGVAVQTQSGRVYRLEYNDNLEDTTWKALQLVAGNGDTRMLMDPAANGQQRFYRVRHW